MNKAGRLVMRGSLNGSPVKVYEAANEAHAAFIEEVCRSAALSDLFPDIIAREGALVVAAWQGGRPLRLRWRRFSRRRWLEAIAGIQVRIHQASVEQFPSAGFDYFGDFIWPRFRRATSFLSDSHLAEKIQEVWEGQPAGPTQFLTHPDLSPLNLIKTAKSRLVIIDNELLGKGPDPLLDVCNTIYALGPKNGVFYAESYLDRMDKTTFQANLDRTRLAWVARRVGTAFVAGDVRGAYEEIKLYRVGKDMFPVRILSDAVRKFTS